MIRTKHMLLSLAALSVGACSGQSAPSPTDPSVVIGQFLDAVNDEDYDVMGRLWGTNEGPASSWMMPDELRKRLAVMQGFLLHREYEVLRGSPTRTDGGRFIIRVKLVTLGLCEPVVPFTVVPWRNDWLVESIDLPSVNPTRSCA